MAKLRTPERRNGPGILFILVVLVVVAIVGAKFFGFTPNGLKLPQGIGKSETGEQTPQDGQGVPKVLVYYSHTSENYQPAEPHAKGKAGQIVDVGTEMVRALEAQGILALHVTTAHDHPNYDEAFVHSLATVNEVLAANDGIEVVLDIHRDALPADKPDGYTTVEIDGKPVAKLLLVVGDLSNPLADQNLAFAELLRDKLNMVYPGIMRGIKVQHGDYNGKVHPNSVQVFIGEYHDNTAEEAKAAAKYLAEGVAALIKEGLVAAPSTSAPAAVDTETQFP